MNPYFNYLTASPSFLEGIARLFDFGNLLTEFNSSLTPEEADAIAIHSDWYSVGFDFSEAIQQFRHVIMEEHRERNYDSQQQPIAADH